MARTVQEPATGPSFAELNVLLYGRPIAPEPEEWRIAIRADGVQYWVSTLGNFAALREKPTRVWCGRDPVGGYPKWVVYAQGRKAPRDIHRVVTETFLGRRPADMVVMHVNSDRSCLHVNNFAYGTQSENMATKVRHEQGERIEVQPPAVEIWRWHPRYASLAVSNHGTAVTRWWLAFNTSGVLYRTGPNAGRRKHVGVTVVIDNRKKTFLVHRLVYETFVGPIGKDLIVRHRDDNPHNNTVENLVLGTGKDNAADAAANGGIKYGDAHACAVYTDEQRRSFIAHLDLGLRTPVAARLSGIKRHNAYRIRSRWLAGLPILASGSARRRRRTGN